MVGRPNIGIPQSATAEARIKLEADLFILHLDRSLRGPMDSILNRVRSIWPTAPSRIYDWTACTGTALFRVKLSRFW